MDWCDAYAYCAGVGKRLCGKIGAGANGYDDFADASQSQWHNACVSGEVNQTHPYGNTYEEMYCNGLDYQESEGTFTTRPVQSMAQCQSSVDGYEGVFDLSGNVWEWEDSCDGTGQTTNCRVRGGCFNNSVDYLGCRVANGHLRDSAVGSLGFRCCSR